MKHLKFEVSEWSKRDAHSAEVCYEYEPSYPLYRKGSSNAVYRAGAMAHGDGSITLVMQHLRLSEPPYDIASMPGRTIDMTFDEFSQYVDALVRLRDKAKVERG